MLETLISPRHFPIQMIYFFMKRLSAIAGGAELLGQPDAAVSDRSHLKIRDDSATVVVSFSLDQSYLRCIRI